MSSGYQPKNKAFYIGCKGMTYLLYGSPYVLLVYLIAYKWLLSSMGLCVCFQTTCLRESLVTLFADKWFFSCMGNLVLFELTRCEESVFTYLASILLLPVVSCIWLLPSMGGHMHI